MACRLGIPCSIQPAGNEKLTEGHAISPNGQCDHVPEHGRLVLDLKHIGEPSEAVVGQVEG